MCHFGSLQVNNEDKQQEDKMKACRHEQRLEINCVNLTGKSK